MRLSKRLAIGLTTGAGAVFSIICDLWYSHRQHGSVPILDAVVILVASVASWALTQYLYSRRNLK